MTGPGAEPDKKLPATAANATSFSGFANTTQNQWKDQQRNAVLGSLAGLVQACEQLQQSPLVQSLEQLGQQLGAEVNTVVGNIMTGLQALADFLCSLITGIQAGGSTTVNTIINGVVNLENAINSSPLVQGILALGGQAQSLIVQFINGLQAFADSLCHIATGGATAGGTNPASVVSGVSAAVNTALGNPFISGLVQAGQQAGAAAGQATNNLSVNLINGMTTTHVFAPVTNAVSNAVGINQPATAPQAGVGQITQALQSFPNQNVVGTLGPSNIGSTVQAHVDTMVNSLTGQTGTGNSLGNLASATSGVVAAANNSLTLASNSSVYIANRSISKPGYSAVDATADAVFPISQISGSSVTTVNVVAATSIIGFIATPDPGVKKSIVWLGQNTANILTMVLNLYSVSTSTGAMTLLFSSPNIIGGIPNALTWNYYNLPVANQVTSSQGQVFAAEMQVTGSGTYQVAGLPNHWLPANTAVFPQQLAAARSAPAVAFDAVGAGYTTATLSSTISGSWSHTAAAGAAVVVAITTVSNAAGAFSGYSVSATYASTPMTLLTSTNDNNGTSGWVALYGLTNVPGGAQTVSISISGGGGNIQAVVADSASYTNAGGFSTTSTNFGNSTVPITSGLTPTSGQMAFGVLSQVSSTGAITLGSFAGGTQRYNQAATDGSFGVVTALGDAPGAGALVTFQASGSASNWWAALELIILAGVPPAPASIASPTYSGNVPWFGMGGSAGRTAHAPSTVEFSTNGPFSYAIPFWLQAGDHIDIIALGAGQGGAEAGSAAGPGGGAGSWTTKTLQYGIDFPTSTTTITGSVGAGGPGGSAGAGAAGTAGGNTTAVVVGYGGGTIVAAGGSIPSTTDQIGLSPGNQTYLGTTYYGGGTQTIFGSGGVSPGGGGAGGFPGAIFFPAIGGPGADGAIWIVARQG